MLSAAEGRLLEQKWSNMHFHEWICPHETVPTRNWEVGWRVGGFLFDNRLRLTCSLSRRLAGAMKNVLALHAAALCLGGEMRSATAGREHSSKDTLPNRQS